MKVFAVRDVKADSFGGLIALPTVGLAVRNFVEAVANPKGPLSAYPEDYSLFEIGEFDSCDGTVVGHKHPLLIMTAVSAVEQLRRLNSNQLELPGGPVPVEPVKERVSCVESSEGVLS